MPQNFKPYINKINDGRVKIHQKDYPTVRKYYKKIQSTRKTAIHFRVPRRLIMFIIHPERYTNQLASRRLAKVHLQYYNRGEHTKAIAKYRAKKKRLNLVITP